MGQVIVRAKLQQQHFVGHVGFCAQDNYWQSWSLLPDLSAYLTTVGRPRSVPSPARWSIRFFNPARTRNKVSAVAWVSCVWEKPTAHRPLYPRSASASRSGRRQGRRHFAKLLDRIARIDVLIAGDWAVAPLADTERRDLLEICDDRYATRSTILAVCNTSALTDYIRSKRSRFITLFQALTKSRTNFSFPSSAA